MSPFEAVGYAKFSGRLGVCAATSGPGAIHLLNGLYDAKLDHVPVLAIVGQTHRSDWGLPGSSAAESWGRAGRTSQEVDLHTLFKDVASDFVETVTVPEQLPNVLDRAIRTAYARRAPTAVIVPGDVQELDYSAPTHEFKMVPSSAGVAKALLGKDALSDELPYVTGSVGLLGTRPSYELMRDCDTLPTIGFSFPYSQFLPEYGKARAVQIDIDPHMVGMRYPYEVNLVGDAKATLERLIPLIDPERGREWYDEVCAAVVRWREVTARRAELSADPINPEFVAHVLDPLLPADAIVSSDSGSLGGSAAGGGRLEQPRPQPGDLGAAGDGRRAVLPALAGATGRAVRRGFARSLGLTGIRVEKPEDVEAGWRAGLAADGPAVIEFLTDPAVPPIPPHATWEQLEATAASILKGDADRASMVKQGFKAKTQEFLPGHQDTGRDR